MTVSIQSHCQSPEFRTCHFLPRPHPSARCCLRQRTAAVHTGLYKALSPRLPWDQGHRISLVPDERECMCHFRNGWLSRMGPRLYPGGVGSAGFSSKALWREVTLENYQNLLALGKQAPPNTHACCQLFFHGREEPFGTISAGTSGPGSTVPSTQKQHPGLEL